MKHFITLFCLFSVFTSFTDPIPQSSSQTIPPQYPTDYFQNPVGHALVLSGTFGELRANHFHSGIDIKPKTKGINEPIYAAAEGYISRIRIQEGGYGQSICIAHPNGYTTLYAHLDKFSPEIQAYARQKQAEQQQFEIDITPQSNEFPMRKGQQIGYMGNRGHSFGQHLHFEIRDTRTEYAINPLLFGFNVTDNIKPNLFGLKVYLLDEKQEIVTTQYVNLIRKADGNYGIPGDTLAIAAPNVAFAVRATDENSRESGENGIYSLELKCDEIPVYQFKVEKFSFDETRYINAHLDYLEQQRRKIFYHRAFKLPGDNLSMYDIVQSNGVTPLSINDVLGKKMTLTAGDIHKNAVDLTFVVKYKEPLAVSEAKSYNYILQYDKENIVKLDGDAAIFYFPINSFYENLYARFFTSNTENGQYSPTFHTHDTYTPIQSSFDIALKAVNLPENLRSKAFIAYCQRDDSRTYTCGGTWAADGTLRAKNRNFGNYSIQIDVQKPTIIPVSFQADMRKLSRLAFKIRDNHEVMGSARPLRYRAELDGEWLMMELDGKYDLLFHNFSEGKITEGVHKLRISVTDDRENEAIFEGTFKK